MFDEKDIQQHSVGTPIYRVRKPAYSVSIEQETEKGLITIKRLFDVQDIQQHSVGTPIYRVRKTAYSVSIEQEAEESEHDLEDFLMDRIGSSIA